MIALTGSTLLCAPQVYCPLSDRTGWKTYGDGAVELLVLGHDGEGRLDERLVCGVGQTVRARGVQVADRRVQALAGRAHARLWTRDGGVREGASGGGREERGEGGTSLSGVPMELTVMLMAMRSARCMMRWPMISAVVPPISCTPSNPRVYRGETRHQHTNSDQVP